MRSLLLKCIFSFALWILLPYHICWNLMKGPGGKEMHVRWTQCRNNSLRTFLHNSYSLLPTKWQDVLSSLIFRSPSKYSAVIVISFDSRKHYICLEIFVICWYDEPPFLLDEREQSYCRSGHETLWMLKEPSELLWASKCLCAWLIPLLFTDTQLTFPCQMVSIPTLIHLSALTQGLLEVL